MKTLFSKILLAQVIAVVLALLVVALLTRASLHRGFIDYLERQESVILKTLAPARTVAKAVVRLASNVLR